MYKLTELILTSPTLNSIPWLITELNQFPKMSMVKPPLKNIFVGQINVIFALIKILNK